MSFFGPNSQGGPLLESDIDRWVTRACLDATTAIKSTPYFETDWVRGPDRRWYLPDAPEHTFLLPRAPDQIHPISIVFSKRYYNTGYDEFRDVYEVVIKFRGVNLPNAPQDRLIEMGEWEEKNMNMDKVTLHVTTEIRKLGRLLRIANQIKDRVSRPEFQRKIVEKQYFGLNE
jgi:hypothetical protein